MSTETVATPPAAGCLPAAAGFTQRLMARLERGLNGNLVVLGDSTGDAPDEWPFLLGGLIGTVYPAFTVLWRVWDIKTGNYAAPLIVQTGTGSATLTIWNGSIPGAVANYLVGPNLYAAVTPAVIGGDPDLVIFSYGHNGGNDIGIQVAMEAAAVGEVQRLCPLTPIVIIGQNPERSGDDTEDGTMRAKVEAFKAVAQASGAGFINVHACFLDHARPLVQYYRPGDMSHPNAAGSALWAQCVAQAFQYQPAVATGPGHPLLGGGVIYSAQSYDDLSGWESYGVTLAKETAKYETNGTSLKVTGNGSAAYACVRKAVIDGSAVPLFRRHWVTANVRLYVPAGNNVTAGRVALYDGIQTITSANGGPQGDGWCSIAVSLKVSAEAKEVWVYVYANQPTPASETVYIDRVTISDGVLPKDAPLAGTLAL